MVTKELLKMWMHENKGAILYDELHYGVFTGYVTFTPARAKMALENNIRNRKLGKTSTNVLKTVMSRNLWDDNVSKINFNSAGELSDGQTRLNACVQSGCTFRCLVTWGVSREAQLVTDRRGTRTLPDDLQIAGYKNANSLAAVTRILYYSEDGCNVQSILNGTARKTPAADISMFYYFMNHQDEIINLERYAVKIYTSVRDLDISKTITNILAIKFAEVNKDDADMFWKRLSEGLSQVENDPIVMLRKRLVDDTKTTAKKLPDIVKAALIIKTWNLYMTGETTKVLKWSQGGANVEKFPEIYNPYNESEVSLA